MPSTSVVNIKQERCDIYIGRGSKWGNPYKIGNSLGGRRIDRARAIELYAARIAGTSEGAKLQESLPELVGKRLGCHCKPLPCHGDVLVALLREHGLIEEADEAE